ncbi:SAM-dependent methyltransferase, partial [Staphylococcus xylosus]|nr:nucleotide pyrophosphohydrolase [Staphylococcus xylosus]
MTGKITIVGLGNYGIDDLPLGIYKFLKNKPIMYTRTLEHPVIKALTDEGMKFHSFDHVYEENQAFDDVYQTIVTQLIEAAQQDDIVYTVPGHPRVAETTTVKLEAYAQRYDD